MVGRVGLGRTLWASIHRPLLPASAYLRPVPRIVSMGQGISGARAASDERAPPTADPDLVNRARTQPQGLTEAEWRQLLSPTQFRVARQGGTQAAFSGRYTDLKDLGLFQCVCCSVDLFTSEHKFDSGSGWPSFFDTWKAASAAEDNIQRKRDGSLGMARTEVLCQRCSAHLGHVFNDGPRPTGLRYCINSASLKFAGQKD